MNDKAVELLREVVSGRQGGRTWVAIDKSTHEKIRKFLEEQGREKCHCGGTPARGPFIDQYGHRRDLILCTRCGHAGKSSGGRGGAWKNWNFTQQAIREKLENDRKKRQDEML